jgi:tetratricopeptide (TPR) repeat protein
VAACAAGAALICLLAGAGFWYQRHQRLQVRASGVQKCLTDARSLFAGNRLALTRQALAEAKGQIGNDREALGSLGNEVDALESEAAKLERFQNLIDRAFQAEMPHALAEELRRDGSSRRALAPRARKVFPRGLGRAAPLLLEALSVYGVMEQDDWNSGLDRGPLGPEQVARIQRTVYGALLCLADDLVVRRADYRTGAKLTDESAGRLGLLYLQKAAAGHAPTQALYRIRSTCRRFLMDDRGARADEQLAGQTPAATAQDHFLLGLRAFGATDKQEAVKQFEAALALEPTHYWSLMFLGVALLDLGQEQDRAEAVRVFTGGIMRRPDDPTGYDLRARAYQELRRYREALVDFNKAIALNPNDPSSLTSRGNVLWALDRLDEALADHERAIRLKPDYAEAHVNLGIVLLYKGRLDQAISEYEQAIALKPDLYQAHGALGNALFKKRRPDPAIAEYEKAIRLCPDDPQLHLRLGICWCDGKREYAKAISEFKEAIRLDSRHAMAHYNLGKALWHKGLIDEASRACTEAVRLKPDFALAHNALGVALKAQGKWDKAVAEFEEAIRRDPKYADPHINLGGIWCDVRRDYDRAIAEFDEAIRLKPDEPTAHFNRGIALRSKGVLDMALAEFKETIRLKQDYPQAHHELGLVLLHKGQLGEAIIAFTEAIRQAPDFAPAYFNLACALRNKGRLEEATVQFAQAIRVKPDYADAYNELAWLLATCPDLALRDPKRALALATKATLLKPKEGTYWNTLGVAHYRAGDWKASLAALQKSMRLSEGGDANDWLFLAMAHWQLGEKGHARQWYDRAVQWMDKNQPKDEERCRFRAEAAKLLGVNDKKN